MNRPEITSQELAELCVIAGNLLSGGKEAYNIKAWEVDTTSESIENYVASSRWWNRCDDHYTGTTNDKEFALFSMARIDEEDPTSKFILIVDFGDYRAIYKD